MTPLSNQAYRYLRRRHGRGSPQLLIENGLADRQGFPRPIPYKVIYHYPSSNPPVKNRVNCVNAMFHNQAGDCRLRISPKCKELFKDLERVHWKNDSYGNPLNDIDKSDPLRTHVSDALGYMIAKEFSMKGKFGYVAGVMQ
jgi:hypothetical protein